MPETEPIKPDRLRPELTAGQMAMVGVGGSIGTGLLLGSGAALRIAGPAVVISYSLAALMAFAVTMALGEMSSAHPGAGSFGIYADLYLNPWAGFVSRYGYWFSIMISISAELVAAATYMGYWFPQVPALVWIALFAALLVAVNLTEVGDFGGFEYWFAMIKVVVIFLFMILGAVLLFGRRVPAQYLAHGGFFPHHAAGPLLAISFGLFSFLGTEMVAISSEEAKSPAVIPRATRITFLVLALIYLGAPAVLVGVLPWAQAGVAQSPFVTVFAAAHISFAPDLMNFVVLTAALSGSNASLYVTARMLYSLAQSGYAPRKLTELTSTGAPRWAILCSTFGIVIALAVQYVAPQDAFLYIIGASLFGGMLAWGIALASHIGMRRKLTPEQVAALPMRAPGGAASSWIALLAIAAVVISTAAVPQSRITAISAGPLLVVLTVFYLLMRKQRPSPKQAHSDHGTQ
jgi:L-asparagine transporter-like permease